MALSEKGVTDFPRRSWSIWTEPPRRSWSIRTDHFSSSAPPRSGAPLLARGAPLSPPARSGAPLLAEEPPSSLRSPSSLMERSDGALRIAETESLDVYQSELERER